MEKKDLKFALIVAGITVLGVAIVVPAVTYGYEKFIKPKMSATK